MAPQPKNLNYNERKKFCSKEKPSSSTARFARQLWLAMVQLDFVLRD
jgi:hypothetical protein